MEGTKRAGTDGPFLGKHYVTPASSNRTSTGDGEDGEDIARSDRQGGMSAVVAQMRLAVVEEGANVTLARNLLAPVLSRLSGGGAHAADLHRRCVLFDCAPTRARVDNVCAALAPPSSGGAIDAVALSEYLGAAVVVFTTPAGAETALRGPAARGSCHAVPPLELGAEMPVIRPTDFKIISDSRIPAMGSPECGTPVACTPEAAVWIEFRDPSVSGEANGGPVLPPRGTKRFRDMIADDDKRRMRIEHEDSIQGIRRTDRPPSEKRRAGVQHTAICFES